jgi:hypothetical protein
VNPIKKGNFLVILIIAIIAFGTSTAMASFTEEYINLDFLNTYANSSNKLIAIDDNDFSPLHINTVVIANNTTNVTNNTTIVNNSDVPIFNNSKYKNLND